MRRLHPDPADPVDATDLIPRALRSVARDDRPYVVANFISSADGRASIDGGSTSVSASAFPLTRRW